MFDSDCGLLHFIRFHQYFVQLRYEEAEEALGRYTHAVGAYELVGRFHSFSTRFLFLDLTPNNIVYSSKRKMTSPCVCTKQNWDGGVDLDTH